MRRFLWAILFWIAWITAALAQQYPTDWYYVVANSSTQVCQTSSGSCTISNTAAAYTTWLTNVANSPIYYSTGYVSKISNITANGALCRLTVASTGGFKTNNWMTVTGVVGATNCNGAFQVTVINATTVDLQASALGGQTYTSGGVIGSGTTIDSSASFYTAMGRLASGAALSGVFDGQSTIPAPSGTLLTSQLRRVMVFNNNGVTTANMPAADLPSTIPIGFPITLYNFNNTHSLTINDNAGGAIATIYNQGESVTIALSDNTSQTGTYKVLGYNLAWTLPTGNSVAGNIPVGQGAAAPIGWVATSGDLTNNSAGTFTISNGAITTNKVSSTNPPYGFDSCVNLQLNVTVSGNALTVAIKGNNGADPSASNPVLCPFHDATETNGDPVWRTLTAATSFATGTSGSSFGTSNAVPSRFWIVAVDNGTNWVPGVVNLSGNGTQIFSLNEGQLQTTTACSACTTATAQGTIYTTAAQTNKPVRILGYFEATEATAGTWATAPTRVKLFGPGVPKPGHVVQTKFITGSTTGSTTSNVFAASVVTGSITPTNNVNLVRVTSDGLTGGTGGAAQSYFELRRGTTTVIGVSYVWASTQNTIHLFALDAPATAAAQPYTVYFANSDNVTSVSYPIAGITNPVWMIMFEEIQG